jgi:hypothetical protein
MLRALSGVLSMVLLASTVQAAAPYVGASEADNEFYRITPAQMAVITAKRGMVTSRSFGQNLLGGLGSMAAKNPIYKFYYTLGLTNLLNYPTTALTTMPTGFYGASSSYAPNNRILHYYCQITPLTNRLDHFEYYLSTAPYQYANDIGDGWAFIEYHPDNGMTDINFFNSYKAKMAAMRTAHPNMKFIYVTAGLWPRVGAADNEAAWTFSDRVMDPANGLRGQVPIFDWRSILSTHPDGTSAGHMMCLEYNTGDATHPNQPFITERLGKALIVLLYKIYCDPPLTSNAGFDRTWYDADASGSETVTLDGSASYDNHHQITSYVWKEGDTVLYSGTAASAAVSLSLGTHNLTLTVTNDAATSEVSVDTVVVKVARPKQVIAEAGPDQTVINLPSNPHTIAEGVTLDGGASAATGGHTIVSYVWTDAGRVIGTSRKITVNLETGVHRILLTVTDDANPPNVDVDAMTLTILESTVRISEGIQALYTFKEGSGSTVSDTSCAYATPLNLTIATPAAVTWVAGGGLTVNSETVIASPGAASRLYDACLALGDVTLEAWVQPSAASQNGPAAILSMATDHTARNFTLGQGLPAPDSAALYNARLRGTGTSSNGEPALVSADGSATTALQHVVYSRQGSGTASLYINGALVASGIHEGLLNVWNSTSRLSLANEVVGGRPWRGKLSLAAVYNRALTSDEVSRNYQVGVSPPTPQTSKILGWQAVVNRGDLDPEYVGLTATPYLECRQGALNTIYIVLSQPVNPATVSKASVKVTGTRGGDLSSLVGSVTLDANRRILIVQMTSMPVADSVKFELLSTVRTPWNQTVAALALPATVALNVTVGSLVGDVTGDGQVSAVDVTAVREHAGFEAVGVNAKYDVDCSGQITGEDMQLVSRYVGNTLP